MSWLAGNVEAKALLNAISSPCEAKARTVVQHISLRLHRNEDHDPMPLFVFWRGFFCLSR